MAGRPDPPEGGARGETSPLHRRRDHAAASRRRGGAGSPQDATAARGCRCALTGTPSRLSPARETSPGVLQQWGRRSKDAFEETPIPEEGRRGGAGNQDGRRSGQPRQGRPTLQTYDMDCGIDRGGDCTRRWSGRSVPLGRLGYLAIWQRTRKCRRHIRRQRELRGLPPGRGAALARFAAQARHGSCDRHIGARRLQRCELRL